MDDVTKDALRAFYRLWKALRAVADDPHHPGAEQILAAVAREANALLEPLGLLHDQARLQVLMRQEFPDYDPTV
jgi:hypothetical protein